MNCLLKRFISSGDYKTNKIRSLAIASCCATPNVGNPFTFEDKDPKQDRRFGSMIFRRNNFCGYSHRYRTNVPAVESSHGFSSQERFYASISAPESKPKDKDTVIDQQKEEEKQQSSMPTSPTLFKNNGSNEKYGVILDTRKLPKLKPRIVERRLSKCRTYVGRERSIRQSPWKLNRICQLAAGHTLEEALTQLKFCYLKNADLVAKILKRTSNLADIRDGLQISQLEVKECFATKSTMLRRIKTMGRGRHGIMHHKFSHIRVVLREIDFPLRIYQQNSLNQKKKWMYHQQRAEDDAQAAIAEREELARLEKRQETRLQKRKEVAS